MESWVKSLSFSERLSQVNDLDPCPAQDCSNRLQSWKDSFQFQGLYYFDEWLSRHGLSVEDCRRVFALTEQAGGQTAVPDWENDRRLSDEMFQSGTSSRLDPIIKRANLCLWYLAPFQPLIALFLQRLLNELARRTIPARVMNHASNATVVELTHGLSKQLFEQTHRTVVLDLSVCKSKGILKENSSEARFEEYLRLFRDSTHRERFFCEYPALLRSVHHRLNSWMISVLEFVDRLQSDWTDLNSLFAAGSLGHFVGFSGESGDSHQSGRSVSAVQFSCGRKIVYKPRSIKVNLKFQDLLSWAEEHGLEKNFRKTKILAREEYGWVEFIKARPCDSTYGIDNFYLRFGNLIAVAYLLGATDIQGDNIIAGAEHPVIVDLETLLRPQVHPLQPPELSQIVACARQVLDSSVLSTLLLPAPVKGGDGQAMDGSGLCARGNQVSTQELSCLVEFSGDSLKVEGARARTRPSRNRPELKNSKEPPLIKESLIVRGFREMYEIFTAHRDELLQDPGVLSAFFPCPMRLVLRASKSYMVVLWDSLHPEALGDWLDREQVLHYLWRIKKACPALALFMDSEHKQLEQGDIPYFQFLPSSRDVLSGDGEKIEGALIKSGEELARQRVENLGRHDMERQLWFISASLATAASLNGTRIEYCRRQIKKSNSDKDGFDKAALLLAVRTGEELEESVIESNGLTTWFTVKRTAELNDNKQLNSIGLLDEGLYDGLAGVALFLAYLGKLTGKTRYRQLSLAAAENMSQSFMAKSSAGNCGGFNGLSGMIYLWSHLACLEQDDRYTKLAIDCLKKSGHNLPNTESVDIISGLAGTILSLISLHKAESDELVLQTAIQCGKRLLERAKSGNDSSNDPGSVPRNASSNLPILFWEQGKFRRGFSHGTSGIAYALGQLGIETGNREFCQAASAAFRYEDQLLQHGQWTDFKNEGGKQQASWCHGAPGIALSRLALMRQDPSVAPGLMLETALQRTYEEKLSQSHCLCHGDLGNWEVLATAATSPQYREQWFGRACERQHLIEEDLGAPMNPGRPPTAINVYDFLLA